MIYKHFLPFWVSSFHFLGNVYQITEIFVPVKVCAAFDALDFVPKQALWSVCFSYEQMVQIISFWLVDV